MINQVNLAPTGVYRWIDTGSDDILLAASDDLADLTVIDYYSVTNKVLNYVGSFPLVSNGTASAGRVVVLPTQKKITIDY